MSIGHHTTSTDALTTAAKNILTANPTRSYLLIQNNGPDAAFFNLSSTATATNGVKLNSGEAWEPSVVPVNQISAISAGTSNIVIDRVDNKATVTNR